MLGSNVIDVALGLIFVYFVLSLTCTSINEYISRVLNLRGETLYETIHGLFKGPDAHRLAEDIYDHALICSQTKAPPVMAPNADARKPSEISASNFSSALMDLLGTPEPQGSTTTPTMPDLVSGKYSKETLKVLQPLIDSANGNLDVARQNIETWFNMATQRSSTWYTEKLRVVTILVAFGVVFVTDADSNLIMNKLWSQPTIRAQISSGVATTVSKNGSNALDLNSISQLIGWSSDTEGKKGIRKDSNGAWRIDWAELLAKFFGLLISAFAVSLGAPFWFDKLKSLVTLKSDLSATSPQARVPSSDAGKP